MIRKLLQLFLTLFLATGVTILLLLWIMPQKVDDDLSYVECLIGAGEYQTVGEVYFDSLMENPYSIAVHRELQAAYLSAEPDLQYRIDSLYDAYSSDIKLTDYVLYAMGFRYSLLGQYGEAIDYYSQVSSDEIFCLDNSLGFVYTQVGDYSMAEFHLKKAIVQDDNAASAYGNLARLYKEQGRYTQLDSLLRNSEYAVYVDPVIHRVNAIYALNISRYVELFCKENFTGFIWEGVVASGLIAVVWLLFLYKVQVFRKKRVWLYLLFFVLGGISSTLCTILYDIFELTIGMTLTGNLLQDLFFCIGGIGVTEELIKLLPVFLFLGLYKKRDDVDSVEYLLMGAFSAVGFAFVENIGYFDLFGLKSIFGRSITATLLHMGLTALPLYGFVRATLLKHRSPLVSLGIYFAVSVLLHGLYDFFLMSTIVPEAYRMIALVIWGIVLTLFRASIQNLLNISKHYISEKREQLQSLGFYLAYSLYFIFLIQFLFIAFRFGSELSLNSFPRLLFVYAYLLLFVPLVLGSIRLVEGHFPRLWYRVRKNKQLVHQDADFAQYRKEWKAFSNSYKQNNIVVKATKKELFSNTLLCVTLLFSSLAFFYIGMSMMQIYIVTTGIFLLIYGIIILRKLYKISMWRLCIDMVQKEIVIYKGRKLYAQCQFAEVIDLHLYGKYRELYLEKQRVILDRTFFRSQEVVLFFYFFKGYTLLHQEPLEEFVVSF